MLCNSHDFSRKYFFHKFTVFSSNFILKIQLWSQFSIPPPKMTRIYSFCNFLHNIPYSALNALCTYSHSIAPTLRKDEQPLLMMPVALQLRLFKRDSAWSSGPLQLLWLNALEPPIIAEVSVNGDALHEWQKLLQQFADDDDLGSLDNDVWDWSSVASSDAMQRELSIKHFATLWGLSQITNIINPLEGFFSLIFTHCRFYYCTARYSQYIYFTLAR